MHDERSPFTNHQMKLTKQFESKISELFGLMEAGRDAWIKAGKLLSEMLDENPNTFEILIERNPSLKADSLELLIRIGRNPVVADLLLSDSYSARKLLHLPDKEIERAVSNPVPVVTQTDNGPKVVQKRHNEMTRAELDQVFVSGRIQPPDDQIRTIEEKEKTESAKNRRYWFDGDAVYFRGPFPCVFKISDLEEIARKAKEEAVKGLQSEMQKRQVKG